MCTNFIVKAGDAGVVNGRSMEFAEDLKSKLFFRGAGHHYEQVLSGPEFGYKWTGKYGFVGMNVNSLPVSVDGVNSKGLATGALWLPNITKYQEITDQSRGLSIDHFNDWVLSSFATCDEVMEALQADAVQVGFPKLLSHLLPLHFPVHDAQGNSIVVEFLNHEVHVCRNPVGVLTNDPDFHWQLNNLGNYVAISPWDVKEVELDGWNVKQTGHGSGFASLPGNATPPSRFVRATMMTNYAFPVDNLDDATSLAIHILNSVDIPHGTARFKSELGKTVSDYPQWIAVKDLARQIYLVRYYVSPQFYSVDLNKIDLRAVDGKQLAVPHQPTSIDLSSKVTSQATEVLL